MSSSRRTRRSTRSPRGRSPSRRSSGRSRRRSSCASASCCRPSTLTSPSSTPTGAPHCPAAPPSPPDTVDAPGLDHDQALTRRTALSRRPLLAYVKSIKGTRDLAQVAWNFINDSLRTTIALQVHSRLAPPASRLPPCRPLRATPPHTAHTARASFACAVPAAMCGGVGGPPGLSVPGQQDGAAHASR
eukprot:scaffold8280_cov59-Phaeocystis_antarctica.AAC.1